ncbi:MAG: hypothetical protein QOD60_2085 [Solirubrobacterales bacterium]|jgi:hypothetical protein|nr:hypothetical protein [Solirubrobacterales bacterium]
MRQAINDNPVVQAVIIGVLLLGGAVMLLSQMGGNKSSTAVQPVAATSSQTGAPAVAGGASASAGTTAALSTAPTATAPAASVGPLVAGPGLPKNVLAGYSSGKTIVLYVYDPKGIEDRDVLAAVNGLKGDSRLAVFTTADKGIARYSRITEGAGVSQVPALVVINPRGAGGGAPKATVKYGFRSSEGVTQAVRDAVYKGKTLGYDPG